MKQSELIKWVDLVSFVVLVLMISTGAVLELSLPARSRGASVLGLTRHQWGDVHLYLSLLFLFLMTAHLVTHFRYIRCSLTGKGTREQNYRIAIGVISLLVLIGLALWPILAPVEARH